MVDPIVAFPSERVSKLGLVGFFPDCFLTVGIGISLRSQSRWKLGAIKLISFQYWKNKKSLYYRLVRAGWSGLHASISRRLAVLAFHSVLPPSFSLTVGTGVVSREFFTEAAWRGYSVSSMMAALSCASSLCFRVPLSMSSSLAWAISVGEASDHLIHGRVHSVRVLIVARKPARVWSELLRLSNKHDGGGSLPPRLEQKK